MRNMQTKIAAAVLAGTLAACAQTPAERVVLDGPKERAGDMILRMAPRDLDGPFAVARFGVVAWMEAPGTPVTLCARPDAAGAARGGRGGGAGAEESPVECGAPLTAAKITEALRGAAWSHTVLNDVVPVPLDRRWTFRHGQDGCDYNTPACDERGKPADLVLRFRPGRLFPRGVFVGEVVLSEGRMDLSRKAVFPDGTESRVERHVPFVLPPMIGTLRGETFDFGEGRKALLFYGAELAAPSASDLLR